MKIKKISEELTITTTPFINVVFCMILFFMVTYNPPVRLGELSTYLPKDKGINPEPIPEILQEKEEIAIYISYSPSEKKHFYSIDASEKEELRTVISKIANKVKDKPADKVPPVTLRPYRNAQWDAVIAIMSEIKKSIPKIKEIQLGSPL